MRGLEPSRISIPKLRRASSYILCALYQITYATVPETRSAISTSSRKGTNHDSPIRLSIKISAARKRSRDSTLNPSRVLAATNTTPQRDRCREIGHNATGCDTLEYDTTRYMPDVAISSPPIPYSWTRSTDHVFICCNYQNGM